MLYYIRKLIGLLLRLLFILIQLLLYRTINDIIIHKLRNRKNHVQGVSPGLYQPVTFDLLNIF